MNTDRTPVWEDVADLARKDVEVLQDKGRTYGNSWKKRGGVGAFMMLARKWDRIEQQSKEVGYDILDLVVSLDDPDNALDDIADLRRYLLLVEEEMRHRNGIA